jgi:hypothetical protein
VSGPLLTLLPPRPCDSPLTGDGQKYSRLDPAEARGIYKQAANQSRFLDYPVEYLFPSWIEFEHQFGEVDDVEFAQNEVRSKTKSIQFNMYKVKKNLPLFALTEVIGSRS